MLFFEGDIFGIIDNGILALVALLGIDLDKKLGGSGVYGGLMGALLGNAISDLVAAMVDPSTQHLSVGVFAGCMYIVVLVFFYLRLVKKSY